MTQWKRTLLALVLAGAPLVAQTEPRYLEGILKEPVLSPDVALFQLRQYILNRVAPVPKPASAAEWTAQSNKVRADILRDVVYHGWPREWVESSPRFEDLGTIDGDGIALLRVP